MKTIRWEIIIRELPITQRKSDALANMRWTLDHGWYRAVMDELREGRG